jgi:O-antigen ligase
VVVVVAVGALLSLWRLVVRGQIVLIPQGPLATLMVMLIPWAAVTLFWTLDPAAAAVKLATVTAILMGSLVLIAAARQTDHAHSGAIGTALVGGFVAAAGILAVDLIWDQFIAKSMRAIFSPSSAPLAPEALNQGACVLAIMVWPVALILWRSSKWLLATGAVVGAGWLVTATPSASAGLAIWIATGGGALVFFGGAWAARALGGSIAALTLVAPALPLTLFSPDRIAPYLAATALPELHRLHLWKFVAENILAKPIGGWGFFASRNLPGGAHELFPGVPLMALHPHNGALQAWQELGLPGAILLAGWLYFLTARTSPARADRVTAAALTATLLAVLTIGSLSYGLWQSWWLAALGIVGCTVACLPSLRLYNK